MQELENERGLRADLEIRLEMAARRTRDAVALMRDDTEDEIRDANDSEGDINVEAVMPEVEE